MEYHLSTLEYTSNTVSSISFQTQSNNGGRCGLCGDNFLDGQPRANEIGGNIGGAGVITRSYAAGNAITVGVKITTNHLGHFEFHLCNLDNYGSESEECFESNRLRFPDGSDELHIGDKAGEFDVTVILPDGLTCSHCVLRWTYVGGKLRKSNPCLAQN